VAHRCEAIGRKLSNGKIAVNTDNYSLATLLAQSGLPADWTPPTGS
jgi:hypothetical protein